ncbi:hypothetical protein BC829DRAFT_389689 [Chytridium lagenaria]|nr:hypothetical protein BC829DRAFT_389689 [Chytridium lagenaria]
MPNSQSMPSSVSKGQQGNRHDETTPLLASESRYDPPRSVTSFPSSNTLPPPYSSQDGVSDPNDLGPQDFDDVLKTKEILVEAKALIPFSWPVSAGYILQNSIYMAAIFSLGQSSTQALAAMALCALFCNVTVIAYGEALKGTVYKTELGRHLQRGLVVMLSMTLPIITLWLFTEPLLLLTGQEAGIAALSATFVKCMIPGLIPYFIAECIKRFLQSQGIMSAAMVVILVVSPINLFLQYMLVCLPKIWTFIKLGTPGIAMTASEWWAFEIVALASGLLGESYLAAQTIVLNTCSLTYMIPLGFGIAATTRIGNSLGAGCPNRARTSAYAAIAVGLMLAFFNSTLLFILSDAVGAVSGGILRGIGRQDLGAYLNIFAYYFMGLPVGLYAWTPWIWLGLSVGLITVKLAQNAHDRVNAGLISPGDEAGVPIQDEPLHS